MKLSVAASFVVSAVGVVIALRSGFPLHAYRRYGRLSLNNDNANADNDSDNDDRARQRKHQLSAKPVVFVFVLFWFFCKFVCVISKGLLLRIRCV